MLQNGLRIGASHAMHGVEEHPEAAPEELVQGFEIKQLLHQRCVIGQPVDNPELLCYSKSTADQSNVVVVVVNLSPYQTHSGWVELQLDTLGLDPRQPVQMHDELSNIRYLWHGARHYVELQPHVVPAHIFRVRHRLRTERDFEYYL